MGYVWGMLMMLFQLLLAFGGACAMIYSGYEGPGAGFIGLLCAIAGTMVVTKIQNWRTKRGAYRPAVED